MNIDYELDLIIESVNKITCNNKFNYNELLNESYMLGYEEGLDAINESIHDDLRDFRREYKIQELRKFALKNIKDIKRIKTLREFINYIEENRIYIVGAGIKGLITLILNGNLDIIDIIGIIISTYKSTVVVFNMLDKLYDKLTKSK